MKLYESTINESLGAEGYQRKPKFLILAGHPIIIPYFYSDRALKQTLVLINNKE